MGLNVDMRDVLNKFLELEKKSQKELGSQALLNGAEIIKDSIISNAPVDTGELAANIEISKAKGSGTNRKVKIGNMNADSDVKRYSFYQEYGSSIMNGTKFMENGFNDAVGEANKAIKETLIQELL